MSKRPPRSICEFIMVILLITGAVRDDMSLILLGIGVGLIIGIANFMGLMYHLNKYGVKQVGSKTYGINHPNQRKFEKHLDWFQSIF